VADPADELQRMVGAGATLSEIVEYLRRAETFVLTPFNFMRLCYEAFGMPLDESRRLLELFDADMRPIPPPATVDQVGDSVLASYRERTGPTT
jgi:hypothetical protein